MANYQSTPQTFRKPTSSLNLDYIDKNLSEKQANIDENFGILTTSVQKVLGTDLIRPEDQQLLKDKVSDVMTALEKTDSINFGSKKSKFMIQNSLQKAVKDPEVLRQIANTQKVRKAQDFMKKRMDKGDLDQNNFQHAWNTAGINDYLANGKGDVGTFQYLEAVDWRENSNERARKLKASDPSQEVQWLGPKGLVRTQKVSQFTTQEMKQYLMSNLSPNERKQIEIEGSIAYGMDDTKAVAVRNDMIVQSDERYDKEIARITKLRDNNTREESEVELAKYDQKIKDLTASKASYSLAMLDRKTAENIGGTEILDGTIGQIAALYTKNGPESINFDSDFLKRSRDREENRSATTPSGLMDEVSQITTDTNLKKDIDPYTQQTEKIEASRKDLDSYKKQIFNNLLSEEKLEEVESVMDSISKDMDLVAKNGGSPFSESQLRDMAIESLGMKFFPPDVAATLRSKMKDVDLIDKTEKATNDLYMKSRVSNPIVYQELLQESKLTIVTPEGEFSYMSILDKNGVTDQDSYKSFVEGNTKDAKIFRASIGLQSIDLAGNFELNPNFTSPVPGAKEPFVQTANIDMSGHEYGIFKSSVETLTGESVGETYDVKREGDSYSLKLKKGGTKTQKLLENVERLYKSGSSEGPLEFTRMEFLGFDIDRTVRNEGNIAGLFSEKTYREHRLENMTMWEKSVASSSSVRIAGAASRKDATALQLEANSVVQGLSIDFTQNMDIYQLPSGALRITQTIKDSEYTDTTGNTSKSGRKTETRTGKVLAEDIGKMPMFMQIVNSAKQEKPQQISDSAGVREGKDMTFNYSEEGRTGLSNLYGESEAGIAQMATEQDAKKVIYSDSNLFYLNNYSGGDQIKAQVEDIFKNTKQYSINLVPTRTNNFTMSIMKQGKEIKQIPIDPAMYPVAQFKKAYDGTPQVFLARYAHSLVNDYIKQITTQ